jgi:hypothetical protein
MPSAIKYMIDDKGSKTSAIVPIRTWVKMNEDYHKLENKLKLFIGLKSAFLEIKEAKRTGKKLQTLKEFLDEGNS